eukprot:7344733-Lingulodinium_polyedra.AAC.1
MQRQSGLSHRLSSEPNDGCRGWAHEAFRWRRHLLLSPQCCGQPVSRHGGGGGCSGGVATACARVFH